MQTSEEIAVKSRIAALDLEPIKFKLVKEFGYSESEVNVTEKWYRYFLFLAFKYKSMPIVVSEVIDAFWHQHILDTRKYAEDCEAAFGTFLHHFPYFGLRGEQDEQDLKAAYRSTLELMKVEFGETPDEELGALGKNKADTSLPSLCSDCANTWSNEISTVGQSRPRLAGLAT